MGSMFPKPWIELGASCGMAERCLTANLTFPWPTGHPAQLCLSPSPAVPWAAGSAPWPWWWRWGRWRRWWTGPGSGWCTSGGSAGGTVSNPSSRAYTELLQREESDRQIKGFLCAFLKAMRPHSPAPGMLNSRPTTATCCLFYFLFLLAGMLPFLTHSRAPVILHPLNIFSGTCSILSLVASGMRWAGTSVLLKITFLYREI